MNEISKMDNKAHTVKRVSASQWSIRHRDVAGNARVHVSLTWDRDHVRDSVSKWYDLRIATTGFHDNHVGLAETRISWYRMYVVNGWWVVDTEAGDRVCAHRTMGEAAAEMLLAESWAVLDGAPA